MSVSTQTLPSHQLWRVGRWLVHGGVLSAVTMQVVRGDYFPPDNSMSQYGVGPDGWIFTVSVALFGLGSLALAVAGRRAADRPPMVATVFLVIWAVCMFLMGFIPADAAASSPSIAGRTHMIMAGLALIALPLAGFVQFNFGRVRLRGVVRVLATALCVLSELSLILLLLTNFGFDITGLGQRDAWALYQSISVVADVVILYLLGSFLSPGGSAKPMAADRPDAVQ